MKLRSVCICFAVILFASHIKADSITVYYDPWEPYVSAPESENKGYVIDILELVFDKYGHSIDLNIAPYARALRLLYSGKADLVPGVYLEDIEPGKVVLASEEIGVSINMFFTVTSSDWRYQNPSSLNSQVLGLVFEYAFPEIEEYVNTNKGTNRIQYAYGVDALQINLKNLIKGRLSVILDDHLVVKALARKLNLSEKIIPAGIPGKENKLLAAFSVQNFKSLHFSQLLSQGIKDIRKTGELDAILKKYDMKDWK